MKDTLSIEQEEMFWSGVDHARRFFMGEADVQRALSRLAGVLELVRTLKLSEDLAADLDPSVRDKYHDLWAAARSAPQEP